MRKSLYAFVILCASLFVLAGHAALPDGTESTVVDGNLSYLQGDSLGLHGEQPESAHAARPMEAERSLEFQAALAYANTSAHIATRITDAHYLGRPIDRYDKGRYLDA